MNVSRIGMWMNEGMCIIGRAPSSLKSIGALPSGMKAVGHAPNGTAAFNQTKQGFTLIDDSARWLRRDSAGSLDAFRRSTSDLANYGTKVDYPRPIHTTPLRVPEGVPRTPPEIHPLTGGSDIPSVIRTTGTQPLRVNELPELISHG